MRRVPVAAAAVILVGACAHDGRALRQPSSGQTLSIVTTTTGPTTTIGLNPASLGTVAGAKTTVRPAGAGSTTVPPSGAATTTAAGAPATGALGLVLPWKDGAPIDAAYTCDGGNIRPTISWSNVPVGTAELAVLIEDEDAGGFVHWLVAGIPPNATSIAPGGLPPGAVQALNGFGNPGWGGPCPPAGASHHYRTQLYGLSTPSGVTEGMATGAATAAVKKSIVALATVTGTFAA